METVRFRRRSVGGRSLREAVRRVKDAAAEARWCVAAARLRGEATNAGWGVFGRYSDGSRRRADERSDET